MFPMGYGLGVFLLAVGLILALAVRDSISAVDVTLVGWILVLAGVVVIALTALTQRSRTSRTVATTTHADGTQTTTEQASRQDPPPTV
jgi:hypothetical protein